MYADTSVTPVLGLAGKGLGNPLAFCLGFDDQFPTHFYLLVGVLMTILRGELIALVGSDLIAATCASIDTRSRHCCSNAIDIVPFVSSGQNRRGYLPDSVGCGCGYLCHLQSLEFLSWGAQRYYAAAWYSHWNSIHT